VSSLDVYLFGHWRSIVELCAGGSCSCSSCRGSRITYCSLCPWVVKSPVQHLSSASRSCYTTDYGVQTQVCSSVCFACPCNNRRWMIKGRKTKTE